MIRVAVIGGGASGLVASIYAKNNNTVVDLYEKSNEIGCVMVTEVSRLGRDPWEWKM